MSRLPLKLLCALTAMCIASGAQAVCAAGLDVDGLLPSGGQRGITFDATVSGKFPKWPVQAWVDRAGVTFTVGADKGKLSVAVAPDAAVGSYWIRFFDDQGASEPQSFVVGQLPELLEQEPNNEPGKAQVVSTLPVVVNGRLALSGDTDVFAVTLDKGQTLIAALDANESLGSPLDAVLQIVGLRGNVLSYNHDAHGLDPQIVFVAPASGTYFVRNFAFPSKPNQTIGFAGGNAYVYRLTLTRGPFADYAWPQAVTAGRESRADLFGWNLPDVLRSLPVLPDSNRYEVNRYDITDPRLANVVSIAVEPHETLAEVEPNDVTAPQTIVLPVTVTGRIENKKDVDWFAFAAKQGEPLAIQVESRALGFPLDAVLQITDTAGKSLVRVDDVGNERDPSLLFSPPVEGQYRVAVSDLNRQGSTRHVYRLRVARAQPDFELTADAHAYLATVGKSVEVRIAVNRKHGFEEDISLNVIGLPEFVTATPVQSAGKGDTAKTVKLALNAGQGAFSGPIRIVGEAPSKLTHTAGAVVPSRTARTSDIWLSVVPAAK